MIFTPIELDPFKRCEEAIEVVIAHYLGHQRNLRTAWGGWELLTVDRRPCSALIIVWSTVKDVTPISSFKVFQTGYCWVVLNGFFTKNSFLGKWPRSQVEDWGPLALRVKVPFSTNWGPIWRCQLRSHVALRVEVPFSASQGPLRRDRKPRSHVAPRAEVPGGTKLNPNTLSFGHL